MLLLFYNAFAMEERKIRRKVLSGDGDKLFPPPGIPQFRPGKYEPWHCASEDVLLLLWRPQEEEEEEEEEEEMQAEIVQFFTRTPR